jgi:Tfp pilus assembly protein PilN
MIKINLLPVKEAKRRKQMLLFVYVGLVAVVVMAGMAWFWWVQYQKVNDLNARIQKVDEESKGYEGKIQEIKDLQLKETALESFRSVIKSIYDDQKTVLGALDQLAQDMPEDVWFNNIEQGQDKDVNTLTVKGDSLSQAGIQLFANRMRKPGGFLSDPIVQDIAVRQDAANFNGSVYTFTLKVKMGGSK